MSAAPRPEAPGIAPVFAETLTGRVAPDAYRFAAPLVLAGAVALGVGGAVPAVLCWGAAVFVAAFFRNPERVIPDEAGAVLAPADGRVISADEVDLEDGGRGLRVAIFLSVFNVHINRAPLAGRVVSVTRGGDRYFAAFRPAALHHNVHLDLALETARGERVVVTQITGWLARRIICQPVAGEWLTRGVRYGLIRFGSRTDVLLPPGSRPRVRAGDRVRGGSTIVASLPPSPGEPYARAEASDAGEAGEGR